MIRTLDRFTSEKLERSAPAAKRTRRPITDFAALDAVDDRTVVELSGRARAAAAERLITQVHRQPAICERTTLAFFTTFGGSMGGSRAVYLGGCDFEIVDTAGRALPVQLAPGTRLHLRKGGKPTLVSGDDAQRLWDLPFPRVDLEPPPSPLLGHGALMAYANEYVLDDGDPVEILGALSRDAAPTASVGREPGWRRTIVALFVRSR